MVRWSVTLLKLIILSRVLFVLSKWKQKIEKKIRFVQNLQHWGNNQSIKLTDFIIAVENCLGITAKKEMLPCNLAM